MKDSSLLSKRPVVVIISNAIDDVTRNERTINTDSPAASRKVFMMARALKTVGVRPYVLSLGRGHANGKCDYFATKVCRVDGVATIYAPFSHLIGYSELLSLFGLLRPLRRLTRHSQRAVIFYNRMTAYLVLLVASLHLGYRSYLDLEDGEVVNGVGLKAWIAKVVSAQFDRYCCHGALLACGALASMTTLRPLHRYYGTADGEINPDRWNSDRIACLMSGTLAMDTGAPMLIEAIRRMRIRRLEWASKVSFEVTGKGDSLVEFHQLALEHVHPLVNVHGRTSDVRYREILRACEIGLALKPVGGELADTTFPSKVIEFASSGLLVLSTDISDVRSLLGEGAQYLERNDPDLLIERLAQIVEDRRSAELCATQGRLAVERQCAPQAAGMSLRNFLFTADA